MESPRTVAAIGAVAVLLAAGLLTACGSGTETAETGPHPPAALPRRAGLARRGPDNDHHRTR